MPTFTSGIGKALAVKFASEGWQVAASARRENLLEDLNKQNPNIYSFPLDVKNQLETKNIFQNVLKKLKSVDISVFCTGMHDPDAEKKLDAEKIREIMETNFFGTLNCITAVNDYFREKKSGHISIVSSPVGYRGLPKSSGYTASKASLNNFTQGIYFDFKKFNVRVSLISPGFIKTALTDKNEFKMPYLRSTEYAAEKIYSGLIKKNKFEIIFPPQIGIIYKIFQILPNGIYNYLINKFVNR